MIQKLKGSTSFETVYPRNAVMNIVNAPYHIPPLANQLVIPANPIPLMNMQTQQQLDNYIEMLMNIPGRIKLRTILLTAIDCSIIIDSLNNGDQMEVNNIRNQAYNTILEQNARWLLESIMQIVNNATPAQRVHIFNRIANLFRNPNIIG